jgi:hypothetical protein
LFTGTSNNSPLPVELVQFSGHLKDHYVDLNWSTAQEDNAMLFEVQRQQTGKWIAIGQVNATGTSKSLNQYAFRDEQLPDADIFYYRLRIMDQDGSGTYSDVVSIARNKNSSFDVRAYPVPSPGKLLISIHTAQSCAGFAELWDVQGQKILSQNLSLKEGPNLAEMEGFDQLSPGIYFLSVSTGTESSLLKVIKN